MTDEPNDDAGEVLLPRPTAAIKNLTNFQEQADMDGTVVTVSRQALNEVLDYLAADPLHAQAIAADKLDREYTKQRVKELTEEGDGFWRACSGCQESSDGVVSIYDYPYSDVFRCQPGSGCGECGGIGVIWDDNDYTTLGDEPAQPSLASQALAAGHASVAEWVAAKDAKIARLRGHIATQANSINIVGSAYDDAMKALDRLVLGVKSNARAALTGDA